MVLSYEQFLYTNKSNLKTADRAYLISVLTSDNTCVILNKDKILWKVPIAVVVNDVINDMLHLNDASRLKRWKGWGTDIKYPDDYFANPDKYFIQINSK